MLRDLLTHPSLVPFSVVPLGRDSGSRITKLHLIMNTSLKVEMHVFHVCDIPSTDRPFEIEMKLLKNCFPFSLRFRAVFESFSVQGRDKGCTGSQRQAIVVPLLEWDWAFPVSIEIFQALFMSKCSFTNSTKHLLNTTSGRKKSSQCPHIQCLC